MVHTMMLLKRRYQCALMTTESAIVEVKWQKSLECAHDHMQCSASSGSNSSSAYR
jgi:hypothetical protein